MMICGTWTDSPNTVIVMITLSARSELRLDSYIHMVLCTRTHEDPRVYKRGKSCPISLSQDPGKRLAVSTAEEDWRSFSPQVRLSLRVNPRHRTSSLPKVFRHSAAGSQTVV